MYSFGLLLLPFSISWSNRFSNMLSSTERDLNRCITYRYPGRTGTGFPEHLNHPTFSVAEPIFTLSTSTLLFSSFSDVFDCNGKICQNVVSTLNIETTLECLRVLRVQLTMLSYITTIMPNQSVFRSDFSSLYSHLCVSLYIDDCLTFLSSITNWKRHLLVSTVVLSSQLL